MAMLAPRLHPALADHRAHVRRRWFVAVTLGELAGFGIPSLVGGLAWTLDVPPRQMYALLVVAGAGEGAVLGSAQWIVLREMLPALSARDWVAATAGAAAFAWSLGMLPSTLGDALEDVPAVVLAPALAAGGVGLLLSVGAAQAAVLRPHVERAWRWIGANVLAWCVGLVASVSLISILVDEDTSLPAGIGVGLLAGALMGASVALVTGWFLVRILER